jgi:hypothetical protein
MDVSQKESDSIKNNLTALFCSRLFLIALKSNG